MRIDELMPGDWVHCSKIEKDGYPANCRVVELSCGSICSDTAGIRIHPHVVKGVHASDISPIPLTPEILNLNGFERRKCDDIELWSLEEEPYLITFMSKNGCPCLTIEDVTDKDSEHNCLQLKDEVYNVHELQHALRLFGIDKQITL